MKLGHKGLGVYLILIGIFLLIINILQYFWNPSSYDFPVFFVFSMIIVTGLFYLGKYYNKIFYLGIVTAVLVVMWVVSFIQPLSPDIDKMKYYMELGIVTLMILVLAISTLKTWKKLKSFETMKNP